MIKSQVYCDFCDKPIPVYPMDIDGKTYEGVGIDLARTKVHNTRDLFPHLCASCAARIDMVLLKYNADMKKQAELAEKFKKFNAERREALGTEG